MRKAINAEGGQLESQRWTKGKPECPSKCATSQILGFFRSQPRGTSSVVLQLLTFLYAFSFSLSYDVEEKWWQNIREQDRKF